MAKAASVARICSRMLFGICVFSDTEVPEDKHQFMQGPFTLPLTSFDPSPTLLPYCAQQSMMSKLGNGT